MIENRVLRRIFGPQRDDVTGDWRKLHAVAWWLRHYASSREVAGSSPNEVDFFLN
jgi:hypothetical protein